MPPKKAAGEYDAGATFHRIRITLTTSKSVANLEKVSTIFSHYLYRVLRDVMLRGWIRCCSCESRLG
jgi:hypothetical protein